MKVYLHFLLEEARVQALAHFMDFVLSHRQRNAVRVLRPVIQPLSAARAHCPDGLLCYLH
jgi:hypothetical protein